MANTATPLNNTYKVWMDEQMYKPHFSGQAAYFLPPLANYVSGPTGMLYNPGTALSPKYKNHFFVAEFVGSPAASGIHAFTLKPKGASFETKYDQENSGQRTGYGSGLRARRGHVRGGLGERLGYKKLRPDLETRR